MKEALKYDKEVMIEKYIDGEEITSFILNGEVFPTVVIKANMGEFLIINLNMKKMVQMKK